MMFLNRVRIANFRTFPQDFELELTPGPGVTLIVGQNGLGKSTFFEAIEWCLTGEVKRLDDLPHEGSKKGDFLARRLSNGAIVESYGVELNFEAPEFHVSRHSFRQDNEFVESQSVNDKDLVNALRASDWKARIHSLGAYLRLTHFLSQSGEQRFAVQDSRDRWTALEAPAGTERLNHLRERLGNKGVTAAFNRKLTSSSETIAKLQVELSSWVSLIHRRDLAKVMAMSEGAISESELSTLLELLRSEINRLTGKFGFEEGTSAYDRLVVVKNRLACEIDACKARLRGLAEMEELAAQWPKAIGQLANAESLLSGMTEQLSNLDSQHKSLNAQIASVLQRSHSTDLELQAIQTTKSNLNRKLQAARQLRELRRSEKQFLDELSSAEAEYTQLLKRSKEATAKADERRSLDREFRLANQQLESLRELVRLSARCRASDLDARNAETQLERLRAKHAGLQTERAELEEDRRQKFDALQRREDELEQLRIRSSEIDSCVASLKAAILFEDTQCPICTTVFPQGELQRLIAITKNVSLDALSSAQNEVQVIRESLRSLERRSDFLESSAMELILAERDAAEKRAVTNSMINALRINPSLAHVTDNIDDYLKDASESVKARIAELVSYLKQFASTDKCDRDATDATVQLKTVESRLSTLHSSLECLRQSITEQTSVLEAGEFDEAFPVTQSRELLSKESELIVNQTILKQEGKDVEDKIREVSGETFKLRADIVSYEKQVAEYRELIKYYRKSWKKASMPGEPSAERIQLESQSTIQKLGRLQDLEERSHSAGGGYAIWREGQEFQRLQPLIESSMKRWGVSKEEEFVPELERAVEQQHYLSSKVQTAREFRDHVIAVLESEATNYANRVLAPLNALNESYLRVLSCFSNLSVAMGVKTQQSSVRLQFILKWLAGSSSSSTASSIRHYLSEGQLSALSVSLLLSMSTAYRWSKWRALLLDDPLQHNDIIHATSFIEVLRNLIRFQGYQVVLSTHDTELADFIRRKMVAAEIPFQTCQFLSTGRDGLKYRVYE